MRGLARTCLEMRAVDLTEVYSSALFNEHSMQLVLSTLRDKKIVLVMFVCLELISILHNIIVALK